VIHCIARTSDGRDVLIRLITKGGKGLEGLDVLQHIATGHRAFLGDNHCLPMLRTLVLEDMTFGVFLFMNTGFSYPWYYDVEEVFNAVLQVLQVPNGTVELFSIYRADLSVTLQGFEFLHHNLVAHRDVGSDNILVNFAEGNTGPLTNPGERPLPFRGRK
jgi:serine/threonine protein kinase